MVKDYSPREIMIREHLLARGIKDEPVIEAMRKIPRELFVDEKYRRQNLAYADHPLPIGNGQTISQPYIVARMLELLSVGKSDRILEIGTGSGYQTALLAELGREVFTIERDKVLSDKAAETLSSLGYKNVHFKVGDGTLGWAENSPYERIIVSAAAPGEIPPLYEQLSSGGKIVMPIGTRFTQILTVISRGKDDVKSIESYDGCVFVPLVGRYGFPSEE